MSDAPTVEAPAPQGNMGQPVQRYDARDKVLGLAKYAADFAAPRMAHAYLVTSPVSLGAVKRFDFDATRKVQGFVEVFTHENMSGEVGKASLFSSGGYASTTLRHFHPLQSPMPGKSSRSSSPTVSRPRGKLPWL